MSMRYKGGVISATPPTTTGGSFGTAPGIWTLEQQMQAQAASTWPLAYDPQFNYVTMLLHGDGTNGGQNNTFLDSSTNNFTITRNGNTTQGSFSPYGSNWSNLFNVNSLSLPGSSALNAGTGAFTIEAWVYPTTGGYMTGVYTGVMVFAATASDGYIRLGRENQAFDVEVNAGVVANQWQHVAISRTGTTVYVFLNGVLKGTGTSSQSYTLANAYIGQGGTDFIGNISNLRFVVGSNLYTSSFTPSTSPLTAVSGTALLTCQSNRFKDNSSNNFTLTPNNNPGPSVQRFSPFAPSAAYSTATIGGSGYFDGSGDYLTIPDNAAWNMGSGDFTAEAWIYPTSFANEAMIMGQWSGDTGGTTLNWALMFSSGSTGYLRLITSSNGSGVLFDLSTSTFALTLNMWQHIAAVRSGSTFTIYVNGVSRATTTNASALYDATNNFTIGAESNSQTQYFAGYISNARVVKGTAVYTGAFTPPTSPVTAVSGTSLLFDCTNGSIYDNAMMIDLETVGNAQISTSVKKYGTGSMSFGASNYLSFVGGSLVQFGTGNFTIEWWMYPTAISTSLQSLFCFRYGNVANFEVRMDNPGQLQLHFQGSLVFNASTNIASNNTWNHVALVRNNGTITMYLNGTSVGSTATSYNATATGAPCVIGGFGGGGNWWYYGNIDDFRITKGYARYTANFTPPTGPFFDVGPTP